MSEDSILCNLHSIEQTTKVTRVKILRHQLLRLSSCAWNLCCLWPYFLTEQFLNRSGQFSESLLKLCIFKSMYRDLGAKIDHCVQPQRYAMTLKKAMRSTWADTAWREPHDSFLCTNAANGMAMFFEKTTRALSNSLPPFFVGFLARNLLSESPSFLFEKYFKVQFQKLKEAGKSYL